MVVVGDHMGKDAPLPQQRREGDVKGSTDPQFRSRKFSRPVRMSRLAGIQGADPI